MGTVGFKDMGILSELGSERKGWVSVGIWW